MSSVLNIIQSLHIIINSKFKSCYQTTDFQEWSIIEYIYKNKLAISLSIIFSSDSLSSS